MDLGRVRRDLGFRGGAGESPRLPDACVCFERQTRKRGAHSDRGTRLPDFFARMERRRESIMQRGVT
eukprot:12455548-Heterocapsa_arctica.AAC.1